MAKCMENKEFISVYNNKNVSLHFIKCIEVVEKVNLQKVSMYFS